MLKKPMMERDPFSKREQKRLIKLTPAQRKKERDEKHHFALMTANLGILGTFSRGAQGLRAVSRARNITANPFKSNINKIMKPKMLRNKRKNYL